MISAEKGHQAGYWDSRFRKFGASRGGYKAVCSYGMPYLYNRYIDLIQMKAFKKALSRIEIRGKRALDAGCGRGRWCGVLVSEGARVTGADISLEAVKKAKASFKEKEIAFIASPIAQIVLPSSTFDLITCVTVLQHIMCEEEFLKSIENMLRLLRPGGEILLLEVAPSKRPRFETRPDVLAIRTEADYIIRAFEERGAKLASIYTVDALAPVQRKILSFKMKRHLKPLISVAALLSLPFDYLFAGSRLFLGRSWHKAFVFKKGGTR
jgi:2-polyprenyl-3-methyl-5-hydroxy-6-metoxy-1,4-benzoquinol methylase